MTRAAPGYATRKHFALAGDIRRRYRNGERIPALIRDTGLSAAVLARIINARSQEGAAKELACSGDVYDFRVTGCKERRRG